MSNTRLSKRAQLMRVADGGQGSSSFLSVALLALTASAGMISERCLALGASMP